MNSVGWVEIASIDTITLILNITSFFLSHSGKEIFRNVKAVAYNKTDTIFGKCKPESQNIKLIQKMRLQNIWIKKENALPGLTITSKLCEGSGGDILNTMPLSFLQIHKPWSDGNLISVLGIHRR